MDSTSKLAFLFSVILFVLQLVSGFQYEVGEENGWKKPTGKEPETYNEWAAQNRFRIGDTLHFKYQKDSVLLVISADYLSCNTSNPISKFEDGNTVFQFDRSGFFYFISGQPGHCNSGQRLIIRVLHPSEVEAPSPAPFPATGGDRGDSDYPGNDWLQPGVNSGTKLSVVSFMTGLCVILYSLV